MATAETRKMVLSAVAAGTEKKAEDTRILELDQSDAGFTDFFIVMSGTNTRQVVAISDEIELRLKREFGTYPNSVEGRRQGEWVLMDYVDFVVHIFVTEKRAYYDIERLRKSAASVDVDQLTATLKEKVATARKKAAVKKAPTKAAPAKKLRQRRPPPRRKQRPTPRLRQKRKARPGRQRRRAPTRVCAHRLFGDWRVSTNPNNKEGPG